MKSKLKIGFIISVTSFLLACNQTKKNVKTECINSVIALDDSLGNIRNHACEKISLSSSITNYTYESEQIDFTNCPSDFSNAFKNHIEAWRNMKAVTDKYPNLRGEMHVLFDSIEKGNDKKEFKLFLKNIWSTWSEIEKTMNSHFDVNKL